MSFERNFVGPAFALLISAMAAATSLGASAADYTVDSVQDTAGDCSGALPGTCTLRAALTAAASSGDPSNTISFSVTGTIALSNNLPAVNTPISSAGAVGDGQYHPF